MLPVPVITASGIESTSGLTQGNPRGRRRKVCESRYRTRLSGGGVEVERRCSPESPDVPPTLCCFGKGARPGPRG
jgi:hypothetical protein